MCVSFCARTGTLFWNHDDCAVENCPFAAGPHGCCDDCRHRQDSCCALTNAPLPRQGGCCHWNVTLVYGWQLVTRQMLLPLGIGPDELDVTLLKSLEVPYRLIEDQPAVDPDRLGLPPQTYGLGTEHAAEESWDWPAWSELWCAGP